MPEKIADAVKTGPEETLSAAVEQAKKPKFQSDTKTYDPTKPFEIEGAAGKIGVIRGHMNTQRLAGKAVATALQGLNVDQRTYEMTYMGIMLQFVTQSPGYLPEYCNGNIDQFLENIYEFEDLMHYYREWENWRNSFRASKPGTQN